MAGFGNQPKILRGAFVEFGISVPPLIVVFQFNPQTITRSRTASVNAARTPEASEPARNVNLLQQLQSQGLSSLVNFRPAGQTIRVQPEHLSFDVRLDATDKLNDGDTITEQFGVAPQLATLETMMLPKTQSVLGAALSSLLGGAASNFAFFDSALNPPIILFVWGRKKILPVNITGMQIREEEFTTDLNPTRVVVGVSLEVIEGANAPYLYSKTMQEAMSLLNLANIADLANTMVPA